MSTIPCRCFKCGTVVMVPPQEAFEKAGTEEGILCEGCEPKEIVKPQLAKGPFTQDAF